MSSVSSDLVHAVLSRRLHTCNWRLWMVSLFLLMILARFSFFCNRSSIMSSCLSNSSWNQSGRSSTDLYFILLTSFWSLARRNQGNYPLSVLFFSFLVMPCCLQGATLQVTLWCHPVVCLWQAMFVFGKKNLFCFFFLIFFIQNFFSPKIFFHFQKNFPTFNFLCISGCFILSRVLKKFSPKFFFHPNFFWVKQGMTQCYQAFLVLTQRQQYKRYTKQA